MHLPAFVDSDFIRLLGRLLLDKTLAMLESDVCDVLGLAIEYADDDVWNQQSASWSQALCNCTAIAHNHAHLAACLYHGSARVRQFRQAFTLACIRQHLGDHTATKTQVSCLQWTFYLVYCFQNPGEFYRDLLQLLRRVSIPTNDADVNTNHQFYGLVRLIDTAVEVGRDYVKTHQENYAQLSQLVQHWDGRIAGNKAIRVDRSKVCRALRHLR